MAASHNLLQLHNGTKSFGSRLLFENANFSVNEGEHIGLIGPNGAGKTTLFKILAGELELDTGEVIRSRELRLGYLKQHDQWNENQSLESFLSNGTKVPIWTLKKWAKGLGLKEEQFQSPINSLSGGYRMRAKLLHLLGEEPNLMLLDEPTNYLDLETLLVLEAFLQDFNGAFLLISHDREFLRRTTDHILEIEAGDFVKFSGNIDDYFEQKELLRSQLEKQAISQAAKRKRVLEFAARFGAKASKARQVQSRLRQLEKMEKIELKPLPVSAKIRIPAAIRAGRLALEVEDADFGYGEHRVLRQVNLKIETGDRVGVVGLNGAGKSTLLKSLALELPSICGKLNYGYQVSVAYYGQHVTERLDSKESVHEALSKAAHPQVSHQEILDLAGSLLFSGDQIKKKIEVLSGGEEARVALGQVLLKKAPLLILDEPTNHLDFYTVESLTQALENYSGTLICVSHDRGFIRRIATRILEVSGGKVRLYPGNYDEYVWSLQRQQMEAPSEPDDSRTEQRRDPPQTKISSKPKEPRSFFKAQLKELEAKKRQMDKALQDTDKKIKILEKRIQEQTHTLNSKQGIEAEKIAIEIAASQKKIEELEANFLDLMTEREELLLKISDLKT